MRAGCGIFRGEEGELVHGPIEGWGRCIWQVVAVARERQVRVERPSLQSEACASQDVLQAGGEAHQRLWWMFGGEVQQAVVPAAELVEAQLEGFTGQAGGERLQLGDAAPGLFAEEGEGHVQVARRHGFAVARGGVAPQGYARCQRLAAGQGEE